MRKRLFIILLSLFAVGEMASAQSNIDGGGAAHPVEGPKNDIKATLLSIFSGSTRITYERVIGSRTSAEATVGIIGLGYDMMNNADPSGIVLKFAYKWNLQKQYCLYTPLCGFYVKPELIYADYDYDDKTVLDSHGDATRGHTTRWALLAEGGWQHIWGHFLFDIYTGLGPSWGDVNSDNYYHGVMLFPKEGHLAFTAGFRLGVAF